MIPSLSACFFIFMAGQIGALQNLLGYYNNFILRFFFISMGILFSLFSYFFSQRSKFYNINSIVFVVFFVSSVLISFLLNQESRSYAIYQMFGIIVWILFGVLVAQATNGNEEGITTIVIGYLLANAVFVLFVGFYMIANFQESFHPVNQRLIGPFDGATVVSEVFFAPLVFGIMLMYFGDYLFGGSLASLGLIFILLTGVRSAIIFTFIVLLISMFFILKSRNRTNKINIIIISLFVIVFIPISVFNLTGDTIFGRLRWDSIVSEGRIQIWLFGFEILEKGSLLFGKGIRAKFFTELPMYEDFYRVSIAWHNTWLALLIETGIVGLLSYSIILLVGLKRLIKAYTSVNPFENFEKIIIICAIFISVRYIFMSFTEMNLYTALSPGVMFFCVIFGFFSVNEIKVKH